MEPIDVIIHKTDRVGRDVSETGKILQFTVDGQAVVMETSGHFKGCFAIYSLNRLRAIIGDIRPENSD